MEEMLFGVFFSIFSSLSNFGRGPCKKVILSGLVEIRQVVKEEMLFEVFFFCFFFGGWGGGAIDLSNFGRGLPKKQSNQLLLKST